MASRGSVATTADPPLGGVGRRRSPASSGSWALRRVLLACGAASSLLYAATDALGGVSYPGYSFTSQAISELMAVGAPSEPIVDPPFLVYDLLMITFGVAVFREGAGRSRALRVTGLLLCLYGAAGVTGPTLFEMHPRGMAAGSEDLPHIILTGVLVSLSLLAMGFGAFALGRRFRAYSLGTLIAVAALGALSAPFGARLGAGLPTPGFGVLERVNVYASLLWIAVLGVALLRAREEGAPARLDAWESDADREGP
jgi:hypothetical membrane protein